jgi:hypothetical protein
MAAHYTVRTQAKNRYCVWDNDTNELAFSTEHRACVNLSFLDALRAADSLNKKANGKAPPNR